MDRWIGFRQPQPNARARLFCFPHAGGAAQLFRTWQDDLPEEVEVCAIQPPGRWTRLREPPIARVIDLVDAAAPALRPLMDMPFLLFGHSLGAVVAFELARRLPREPSLVGLLVSSRRAPQLPIPYRPIHHLPDTEFVREMCQQYGGIPEEVLETPELLELLLPALRADMEAFETYSYSPAPPLECPIRCYGGLDDRVVSANDLEQWAEQTVVSCSVRMFPGGHFFINTVKDRFLATLWQDLLDLLEAVA